MGQLSNESLAYRIKSSKDKKEQMDYLAELYQNNYYYIRKICKKYSGYEELDDLMQEAFFGVRIAVERYDPDQGIPFINYASYWIKQNITRYIENCGSVVRLPVYLHNNIIKYEQARKTFLQEQGREPTDQELQKLLSLNTRQLRKLKEISILVKTASVDTIISEDDSITIKDIISDPEDRYEKINDQMDDDIKKQDIWDAVATLDDRKALIIKKRFMDDMSLKDIGDDLGISNERVRQQQAKALRLLAKSEKIRIYADEYLSAKAYLNTGLNAFLNTGTSVTERVALDRIDRSIQANIRNTDRRIRRNKKRTGTMFDSEFLKDQMEKGDTMHRVKE